MLGATSSGDPKKGIEAANYSLLQLYPNALRFWGMRITDAQFGITYVLTKGLVDNDKTNNNNFQPESSLILNQPLGQYTSASQRALITGSVAGSAGNISKHYRYEVMLGNGASGIVVNIGKIVIGSDVPNQAILSANLHITGIRTDYTNGFAGRYATKWKKNAGGVWAKVGTDVNEIENSAGGATTVAVADDGASGLEVTVTTAVANHYIFGHGLIELVAK